VLSSFIELLLGVLLLIREKILSSPAFEWGIVITTSATVNSRSNLFLVVPGVFKPHRYPQRTSTLYGSSTVRPALSFTDLGMSSDPNN